MFTFQLVADFATACGALLAGWQLVLVQRQARSQFEDSLTQQYREILRRLPVEVLLDEPLSDSARREALPTFYHYFDLCNEQAFLRRKGRVRKSTWEEWQEGILGNLERPAFAEAWQRIGDPQKKHFQDLHAVIERKAVPGSVLHLARFITARFRKPRSAPATVHGDGPVN